MASAYTLGNVQYSENGDVFRWSDTGHWRLDSMASQQRRKLVAAVYGRPGFKAAAWLVAVFVVFFTIGMHVGAPVAAPLPPSSLSQTIADHNAMTAACVNDPSTCGDSR
jgi:hypothetical protein